MPSAAEAAGIAARLMQAVQQPLELAGQQVYPTASIGAALSAPGIVADQLLAEADRAMYAAKAAGRGRWRLAAAPLPPRTRSRGGGTRAASQPDPPPRPSGRSSGPFIVVNVF